MQPQGSLELRGSGSNKVGGGPEDAFLSFREVSETNLPRPDLLEMSTVLAKLAQTGSWSAPKYDSFQIFKRSFSRAPVLEIVQRKKGRNLRQFGEQ